MIIVRLIGGLGNQMFQYALGRHLAIKNNCTLKLDISGFKKYPLRRYELDHFNIIGEIASPKDIENVSFPLDRLSLLLNHFFKMKGVNKKTYFYVREKKIDFIPEILSLKDYVYLAGYWQSYKYFSDISDIIKKDFSQKNKPEKPINSLLNVIENCESVSLHIRRGDYVSNKRTNEIHGFIGLEYYKKAIEIIQNNVSDPHFFVFSDDIVWAKMNINCSERITFMDGNLSNHEDFRLMTACKHHIIANSSFSWWTAWLTSDKNSIVIAPKNWFSGIAYKKEDRIPEEWLII
jgi:hypothetical protein